MSFGSKARRPTVWTGSTKTLNADSAATPVAYRLSKLADSFRLHVGNGFVWFSLVDERILFVARPPCVPP